LGYFDLHQAKEKGATMGDCKLKDLYSIPPKTQGTVPPGWGILGVVSNSPEVSEYVGFSNQLTTIFKE
jgi:hypothetical protein